MKTSKKAFSRETEIRSDDDYIGVKVKTSCVEGSMALRIAVTGGHVMSVEFDDCDIKRSISSHERLVSISEKFVAELEKHINEICGAST